MECPQFPNSTLGLGWKWLQMRSGPPTELIRGAGALPLRPLLIR